MTINSQQGISSGAKDLASSATITSTNLPNWNPGVGINTGNTINTGLWGSFQTSTIDKIEAIAPILNYDILNNDLRRAIESKLETLIKEL